MVSAPPLATVSWIIYNEVSLLTVAGRRHKKVELKLGAISAALILAVMHAAWLTIGINYGQEQEQLLKSQ